MKTKTHKGTAKRIKVTKKKKFIHAKAGRNHLLVRKGASLRSFRAGKSISTADYKKIKALLPYAA